MTDKRAGPYRICLEDSDGDVKRIDALNAAYLDGFKAGLERAAKIANEHTGWEANTIRTNILAEIKKG